MISQWPGEKVQELKHVWYRSTAGIIRTEIPNKCDERGNPPTIPALKAEHTIPD